MADDDDELFAELMGGVTPLPNRDGTVANTKSPPPVVAPVRAPPFTVEDGCGRAKGVSRQQLSELRAGRVSIDATIDLHGLRAAPAHQVVTSRIQLSLSRGDRCLLLIHGRGLHSGSGATLRDTIISALSQPVVAKQIVGFCSAQGRHGGDGAMYVLLRRQRR